MYIRLLYLSMQLQQSNSKIDKHKEHANDLVYSYITLRNLIGFCGLLLPVILIFFTNRTGAGTFTEPSISDYYYTSTGDILVVLLSVLAVFLFTYTGYTVMEWLLTTIAAICAIGIAFSPTTHDGLLLLSSIHVAHISPVTPLGITRHFLFAGAFFISIAIMSIHFFPKHGEPVTSQKVKRNRMFKICGYTMLGCIILMAIYLFAQPAWGKTIPVIFILESIAIIAFSLSWLTKGETLWPDGEHYISIGFRFFKRKFFK